MCVHNVNQLPDDCLLPIFDRVPLLDLLRLDRVCARWMGIIPSACARRRTLVLIFGRKGLNRMHRFTIPFNTTFEVSFDGRRPYFDLPAAEREASLMLPFLVNGREFDEDWAEEIFTELARIRHARLSGRLGPYLADLFPNLDTLVVIHRKCGETELHSVIGLVESWSSLNILKLWIRTSGIDTRHRDDLDQHPVRTLLASINRQSSLRQLTLDIASNGFRDLTFPVESYSFIGKLSVVKICLGRYDHNNQIWNILDQFDHPELLQIGLGKDFIRMDDVLNEAYQFATKVREIYWNMRFGTAEQLSDFCGRFADLTSVSIRWSLPITFTQLVSNLALLTQLTRLRLAIFSVLPENAFALVDRLDDVNEEADEEIRPRISLPQVKIVELDIIFKSSHNQFESLCPHVFPSVEVIILEDGYTKRCSTCRVNINRIKASRCHRRLIVSLKNKFANNNNVRLYGRHGGNRPFVDWSNYTEDDDDDDALDVPVIGVGDH